MSGSKLIEPNFPSAKVQSEDTAVTLEDLQEYVRNRVPDHFSALKPLERYVFAKLFTPAPASSIGNDAASGDAKEMLVLLVGTIHYNGETCKAWALATGENVHFYLDLNGGATSNSTERPLIPVNGTDALKISFIEPFNKAGPTTSGGDSSSKRQARRQMLINYAFMLQGELKAVKSLGIKNIATGMDYFAKGTVNVDPREVFKSACSGYYRNSTLGQKRLAPCSEGHGEGQTDDQTERSMTKSDNDRVTALAPWPPASRGAVKHSCLAANSLQKVALSTSEMSENLSSPHSSPTSTVDSECTSAVSEIKPIHTSRETISTSPGEEACTMPTLPVTGLHKPDRSAPATLEDTTLSSKRMRSDSMGKSRAQPPVKRINTGAPTRSLQGDLPNQEDKTPPASRVSRSWSLLQESNNAFMAHVSDIVTELDNERRQRAIAESELARLKTNQDASVQEQAENHRRELDLLKEIEQLTYLNADLELELVTVEQRAREAEDKFKKAEEDEMQWREKCDKMTRMKESADAECEKWKKEADKREKDASQLSVKHQHLKDDFAAFIQRKY